MRHSHLSISIKSATLVFTFRNRIVNEMALFPVILYRSLERKRLIDRIRRKGDFVYNSKHQEDGKRILCRNPQKRHPIISFHYRVCPNCKGHFLKDTLRRHYRNCSMTPKGIRDVTIKSRKLYINLEKSADRILPEEVFPHLRDDPVVNAIRNDKTDHTAGKQVVCQI